MKRPSIDLRKRFKTNFADRTAFAANARLLQSIWRHECDVPHTEDYFGNFIEDPYAHEHKFNLLSDNVRKIAAEELAQNAGRSYLDKKVIKEDRLFQNLLASQPLAFNLFGELKDGKYERATQLFCNIIP